MHGYIYAFVIVMVHIFSHVDVYQPSSDLGPPVGRGVKDCGATAECSQDTSRGH